MDDNNEIWTLIRFRNIKEQYEVSNYGRIRSIKRDKIMKSFSMTPYDAHQIISLRLEGGGRRSFGVHVLVANAFIPNPDNKPVVHHKDGDLMNNCVDNLMWVTVSEHQVLTYQLEQRDRKYGEKCPNAKYTTTQYTLLAKLMHENELNIRQMSEVTGISVPMVREFVRGNVVWADAREQYDTSNYTGLQFIEAEKMERAVELIIAHPEMTNSQLSNITGISAATISNILNGCVSNKWRYLYDKYDIPIRKGKEIIVVDDRTTRHVNELALRGSAPKEILKELDLPDDLYLKVYRICLKYAA